MPIVHASAAGGASGVEWRGSTISGNLHCRPADKVIHVGAIPPPYGGVSVHLQRLLPYLAARQIPHCLIDLSGSPKTGANVVCLRWRTAIMRLLREPRAVLHFHNFTPLNLPVYALLGLRHVTLLSLHNARFAEELNRIPAPARHLLQRMFARLAVVIVDSETAARQLRALAGGEMEVVVCPEFLPPSTLNAELPRDIITLRQQHTFLLASTASRLCRYHGVDLYGVDLLVDLINRLVHEHRLDAAMVFLLPSIGDEAYFAKLNERLQRAEIGDRFLFVTQPVAEACAVWRISDVVIRATNTDGNSLTVSEALWCGTPVIASDCAVRDPEVVLFKTRDVADLTATAARVLARLGQHRSRLQSRKHEDHVEPLLRIYRRFLRNG